MIVYRYLSEKELELIKQGKTNEIGYLYSRENFKEVNTHKYKIGVKYLHFFKNCDKRIINQIRYLHKGNNQNYYICKFDIPLKYLIFNAGIGRYESSGYKIDKYTALEFAIDAKKIKPEWLVSYELDKHKKVIEMMK